jgi:FkbM family methyltransferase
MLKNLKSWISEHWFIKAPRVRRAVTRVLEGDHDQTVEVLGTTLSVNTIKEHGYVRASRLCQKSSLLRDEVAVLLNLAFVMTTDDTFVDVGANVGFYTHTFGRLTTAFNGPKVYAFEPNPDTFARLKRSARAGVDTRNAGASDEKGRREFIAGAVSHVFTTTENTNRYHIKGPTQSLDVVRLDGSGIEGDSIVIKIDVEGQEMAVLRGATGLFEAGRVKAVYLDGYADPQVETFLQGFGFRLFEGRSLTSTSGRVFSLLALHPAKNPGLRTADSV